MAHYLSLSLNSGDEQNKLVESGKLEKTTNPGSGDFDYENALFLTSSGSTTSIPKFSGLEKCFDKQAQNTQTLVTTIEYELAKSRDDIHYLHTHIYSAEEMLPKRYEACQNLKSLCKEQVETASTELIKWKRKSERFDTEIKELERRIGSWQCIIDRAKQVQIEEQDLFN